MKQIFQIEPVFEERLWGGQELRNRFHYESDLKNIAEVYNVIAIPGHLDCRVMETGENLSAFYHTHHEYFRCAAPEMPVRMILCAAQQKLSIQLHPDDDYALAHEGMRGKPEGSLVVDCKDGFEMIHGHYAKSLEEFQDLAEKEDWDRLCRRVSPKKGEYIHIPSGTLHAFMPGAVVVAFSVNGDVTYRLHDYDRKDPKTGKKRQLHREDVYRNVNIPDRRTEPLSVKPEMKSGCLVSVFHDEPGVYTCGRLTVEQEGRFQMDEFYFVTCIGGEGRLGGREVKLGETYFIPAACGEIPLTGPVDFSFITYREPQKS